VVGICEHRTFIDVRFDTPRIKKATNGGSIEFFESSYISYGFGSDRLISSLILIESDPLILSNYDDFEKYYNDQMGS